MNVHNAHAVDEGSDCTQSSIVASVVTSMITALVVIAITIAIHTGVWFYRKSHPDQAVGNIQCHELKDSDEVYETVDDKADTVMSMTTNEAYGTNKH